MILKASNNYQTLNVANIFSIFEDLQSLVQGDIENRTYQVQRLLVDELDEYKERGNYYVDENIKEKFKNYIKKKIESNGKMKKKREYKIKIYEVCLFTCQD